MTVSIDLTKNSYIITGDVDLIKNKRRAKSNFEAYGANFGVDNQIQIPFSPEINPNDYGNEENQYKAIIRLLDKFGIDYTETEQVKNAVFEIKQENENFEKFSLKAKNIRNNIHEQGDFKNFTSIISQQLTRKLYPLQLLSAYHLAFFSKCL